MNPAVGDHHFRLSDVKSNKNSVSDVPTKVVLASTLATPTLGQNAERHAKDYSNTL
jgi:hypothetical protein